MLTLSSRPTPASRFSDRCAFSAGPRLSLNSGFARSAVVFVWQSVDLACTAPSKFSFACTHTHARVQGTPIYFHLKFYGSVKCVYECVVCVYREGLKFRTCGRSQAPCLQCWRSWSSQECSARHKKGEQPYSPHRRLLKVWISVPPEGCNHRNLISNEPLVCSKMCFSKTEHIQ